MRLANAFFALALTAGAMASPALAEPNDGYEMAVMPGNAASVQVVVRINVATGQSAVSVGSGTYVAIADPKPVPKSVYRLYSWNTFELTGATRNYSVYRLDAQSGRTWYMNFDGKATASWVEVAGP